MSWSDRKRILSILFWCACKSVMVRNSDYLQQHRPVWRGWWLSRRWQLCLTRSAHHQDETTRSYMCHDGLKIGDWLKRLFRGVCGGGGVKGCEGVCGMYLYCVHQVGINTNWGGGGRRRELGKLANSIWHLLMIGIYRWYLHMACVPLALFVCSRGYT